MKPTTATKTEKMERGKPRRQPRRTKRRVRVPPIALHIYKLIHEGEGEGEERGERRERGGGGERGREGCTYVLCIHLNPIPE